MIELAVRQKKITLDFYVFILNTTNDIIVLPSSTVAAIWKVRTVTTLVCHVHRLNLTCSFTSTGRQVILTVHPGLCDSSCRLHARMLSGSVYIIRKKVRPYSQHLTWWLMTPNRLQHVSPTPPPNPRERWLPGQMISGPLGFVFGPEIGDMYEISLRGQKDLNVAHRDNDLL